MTVIHLHTADDPDVVRTIDIEADAGEIIIHDIICGDDRTHRATSSYTLADAEALGRALLAEVARAAWAPGQRELRV